MFHALAQHVELLVRAYGALGIFSASLIEEMFAPIPSTIVVFTGGVIMTKGLSGASVVHALLWKVIVPSTLGMSLGSLFPYFIAKIGEKIAVQKFGRLLRIDWSTVERMQEWTKKSSSDELIIFTTRALPGIPTMAVSILAGLARIPLREYLVFTVLGCFVRTSILATVGWAGGRKLGYVMELFSASEDRLLIFLMAIMVSMIGAWIVIRAKRPKASAS